MRNPWLTLWLNGADAWMGAARGLSFAEIQREQMRMIHEVGQRAIQVWAVAWMFPWPARQRPIAERMAALSLRVVAGGRG
ncbi:hypothetical protein GXW71_25185 [Roseomonas hellenica]|uniref:Uncharacterized protein n=1 Tax=Plastoroseomonas hellenica TaxID=2687306 RepID=A0ABS5F565_9PROT|nr:hypothetical protein [Plastoroseomonas hellenica]MBR0667674.1 hypothetical protein [Plastoroseomonas hellenica]